MINDFDNAPPLSHNCLFLFLHLPLSRSKLDGGRWKNPHFMRGTPLKRVIGRIFTINKWFHRSKQKLDFVKTAKNCENLSAQSKCSVMIFRTLKKYSSCDTTRIPLTLLIPQHYSVLFLSLGHEWRGQTGEPDVGIHQENVGMEQAPEPEGKGEQTNVMWSFKGTFHEIRISI